MRHYKPTMLKLLTAFSLTLFSVVIFAQVDSNNVTQMPDTVRPIRIHGSLAHFIVAEVLMVGTSYYASKPSAYGDKVTGWLYAGSSAVMLVYIPFYWTDKNNNIDPKLKKEKIWNTITMVGLSYGFSRIARYNLLKSSGDTFATRLKRNLIESHAAYFVPILTGIMIQKLLFKNKPTSKTRTTLQFDGSNLYLTYRF